MAGNQNLTITRPISSSLVTDSKAKGKLMKENWHMLYGMFWEFLISMLIVSTSVYGLILFNKLYAYVLALGTVLAAISVIQGVGKAYFTYLLHIGRFDILSAWSRNTLVSLLYGTVYRDEILQTRRHRSSHDTSTANRANSVVINIDSDTKKELMNEYYIYMDIRIVVFIGSIFLARSMTFLVKKFKKPEVLPMVVAAVVMATVCFILIVEKVIVMVLLHSGCQSCVRAWSRNMLVRLLFDHIEANAIFDRIQDNEASPAVITPHHDNHLQLVVSQ
ncbi:hypothetical protein ABFX02_04G224100 [Erythranthe guttata]